MKLTFRVTVDTARPGVARGLLEGKLGAILCNKPTDPGRA